MDRISPRGARVPRMTRAGGFRCLRRLNWRVEQTSSPFHRHSPVGLMLQDRSTIARSTLRWHCEVLQGWKTCCTAHPCRPPRSHRNVAHLRLDPPNHLLLDPRDSIRRNPAVPGKSADSLQPPNGRAGQPGTLAHSRKPQQSESSVGLRRRTRTIRASHWRLGRRTLFIVPAYVYWTVSLGGQPMH